MEEKIPPLGTTTQPSETQLPTQTPIEEKRFFTRKKIIIFSALLLFIITGAVLFYFLNEEGNQTLKPTPNLEDAISNSGFDRTVPDVQIANYSFQTENPEVPNSIPIYTLKSDFTKEEVDSIANAFNLTGGVKEGNEITYAQTTPADSAIFSFNTTDGSFTYQAFTPTTVVSTNPQTAARTVLSRIGLTDTLIDCGITYKRAETPDITYVECHRSWNEMRLPLVSLPGFYNTPEEINLSQMEPGIIDGVENRDPSITQVSTGQNGLSRPTDFNSTTVLVRSNGSVLSVVSNLKWIDSVSEIPSKELRSPEEAKEKFLNPLYSIILPAGEGIIDLEKVFPSNKGSAKNAIITGYNLVYLEKLRGEKQTVYEPFYIVRGETTLENGFSTKLVQAIPARTTFSSISQQEALQLDTFTPSPTIAPNNKPAEIAEENICEVTNGGIGEVEKRNNNYVFYSLDLPGYGKMDFAAQTGSSHTLILRSWDTNGSAFTNARNAVDKLFENSFVQVYTSIYKGTPQILPYTNMAGYYKENPPGDTFGSYRAGIPDPRAIKSTSRQQMLKNYEAKVLAFDRGEQITADGPGFSLISQTNTNNTSTGNYDDWNLFFLIDENSLKNPCYITGSSPSIFFRGSGNYKITPSHITYSEPGLTDNSWGVEATDNKLIVNGKSRDFLYYEFDSHKVILTPTSQGYSFNAEFLPQAISQIAQEMGLTHAEEKQLFNEVSNEISGNSQFITLKLVPQDELDEKLPLSISPEPNSVTRVQFIIEEGNGKVDLEKPELPEVDGENTILELGASK